MQTITKDQVMDVVINLKQETLHREFNPSGQNDYNIAVADSKFIDRVLYALQNVSTVECVPVRHAFWMKEPTYIQDMELYQGRLRCSSCSNMIPPMEGNGHGDKAFKYCPNCGALMDGVIADENIPAFKESVDLETNVTPFGGNL